MPSRIEDYALIGDCETAALVGRDGSMDWLCWPRFDSDACFAALLGTPEHGCWRIAPTTGEIGVSRRYRPGTLILETEIETPDGAATLIDFMPPRGRNSDVVRLVVGRRGKIDFRSDLALRFAYGRAVPWVTRLPDGDGVRAIAGPDMVVLHTPAPLRGEQMRTLSDFSVGEGETVPFVLTYGPSHLPVPNPIDPFVALEETQTFWTEWVSSCRTAGEWSEAVQRSLITLKALTYAPTGGIVAAATTSLPEQLGGVRNWDYRYCWLRDATLTLMALMNAGFYDEAAAWRDWLLRAAAGRPDQLQIMYGLAGERRLAEWVVDWLPGYEGAAPVRIGNAAHDQLQLDVYGEVMDAFHQARRGGLAGDEPSWALQRALVERLEQVWEEPDEGIWEVRNGRRCFTYSRVMAWVAIDRAVQSVEDFGLDGPVDRWRALRERIHEEVCRCGFNTALNSFVQTYGSDDLDASLLLLPSVGFLPPEDPRIRGTVEAIERRLKVNGFIMRYDTRSDDSDGLPPGEGAFIACSFWLADAYVMLGRLDDARHLFEHLLGLCNDVGLLSEEYDAGAKRLVGNFPQAFSHIALVNTAHNLTRAGKPAEQRAGRSGGPG